MLPVLDGVVMELQDCALPLLKGEENLHLSESWGIVCKVAMDTADFKLLC